MLLEIAALVRLRVTRPDLERPWRIPLGTVGTSALVAPSFAISLAVCVLSLAESSRTAIACGGSLACTLSVGLYWHVRGSRSPVAGGGESTEPRREAESTKMR